MSWKEQLHPKELDTLVAVEKFILFLRKQDETENKTLENAIEALGYYKQDLQNKEDTRSIGQRAMEDFDRPTYM